MLNARDSKYYEEDKVQALKALKAFEGGFRSVEGLQMRMRKNSLNLAHHM